MKYLYWLCRILVILGLCECLIILLSKLVDKESLIYSSLQRGNIVMYLPNLEQHSGEQLSGRNRNVAGGGNRGGARKRKEYDWLLTSPLFSHFDITEPEIKKKVTLVVIVSSGAIRFERRQAIRDTWWDECKQVKEVVPECFFMTDYRNPGDEFYQKVQEESLKYKDIRFQRLEGGFDFGQRMLYHMVYALTHYEFDYFLRMDDDHFFCLQNFLHEVPLPMIKQFHWGWMHHYNPRMIRPEENLIMFSHDALLSFVTQDPSTMLCHPWTGTMIASWSNNLNMTYFFRHDSRIHHKPVSRMVQIRKMSEVCKSFISVHGTYPDDMHLFGTHRGPKEPTDKPAKDLFMNSQVVPMKFGFDWRDNTPPWRFEPKLCATKPTWNTANSQKLIKGNYAGREGKLRPYN